MSHVRREEETIAYHAMSAADALRMQGTPRAGFSEDEVAKRRTAYGRNTLPQPRRRGPLQLFFGQFTSALMAVLLGACALALVVGQKDDALLIALIVVMHAVLGFVQEYRADRAFERLSGYLPEYATVLRAGGCMRIPAVDVVVGDIVLVETGMRIVADARVLTATGCEANEAALTGESAPVAKDVRPVAADALPSDRSNMLFAGTTLAAGYAEAVVVAIGGQTEFGRIAALADRTRAETTPLKRELAHFSRTLLVIVLIVLAVVVAWGIGKGIAARDMVTLAIALAVAVIPEGLLVTLTVILALGMQRMAKRRVLARTLLAAETLGSVTVICADKTGTMTLGDMSVTELVVNNTVYGPSDPSATSLLTALALCTTAQRVDGPEGQRVSGSLTERALFAFLAPYRERLPLTAYRLTDDLPFTSSRKYAARRFLHGDTATFIAVGAPDVLLSRVDCTDAERGMYLSTIEQMSGRGLRVLIATERKAEGGKRKVEQALSESDVADMRVVGFVGLDDPVRPAVPGMIAEAEHAGIRTVMLTGDHPRTARAVARAIGLPSEDGALMTGVELRRLEDAALRARVGEVSVFARIMPEDKLRIVRALQATGQTVAMSGDGVNDAPALRAADVGIAVGSGTDVAKEAADIVLLDNDFGTIIGAVREGRGLFDNIRKVVVYLMTSSGSELVLILAALVLGLPLPLLPVHILWINLLADGLPSLALAAETPEADVMREPPRAKDERILRRDMAATVVLAGLVTDGVLVLMLVLLARAGVEVTVLRTLIFVTLGLTSTLYIFALRSFRRSLFASSLFGNRWLLAAVALSIVLLFVPIFVEPLRLLFAFAPLPLVAVPFLVVLAVVKVLAIETAKFMLVRR